MTRHLPVWLLLLSTVLVLCPVRDAQAVEIDCPDPDLRERIVTILERYPEALDPDQINYVVRRLLLLPTVRNVTADVAATHIVRLHVAVRVVIDAIDYDIVDGVFWERDLLARPRAEWELPLRYSPSVTRDVGERARQVLVSAGYRDAYAEVRLISESPTRSRLLVRLYRGRRYTVERLVVDGTDDEPPRSVRLEGRAWTDSAVEEASADWAGKLREQGYLDATVRISCEATAPGQAVCHARVRRGPLTVLTFSGNHTFSDADLLDVVNLDVGRRYGVAELKTLGHEIEAFYLEQAFYAVSVSAEVRDEGSDGRRIVRFHIDEGRRTRFTGLRVKGMPPEFAGKVSDVLEISPRRLDVFFRGKVRTLESGARSEEANRLQIWLQQQGYLDATVEDAGLEIEDGRARWVLRVASGPRVYLGGVEVIGDAPGLAKALEVMGTGFVARPSEIEETIRAWLAERRADGFLEARARFMFQRVAANELVVRIVADQGPRYRIADIAVAGLLRMRERAVLGVLPMRPGDIAKDDQLQQARLVLIERRVFGRVEAAWQLIDPATGWTTPVIRVVERSAGELEFGVLFTTEEGLGFDLRLAHNRIGGVFRSLQLIGSVLYQPEDYLTGAIFREAPWLTRWSVRYREPIPARFPVFGDLTGTLELNRNDRDIDWLTYNVAAGPTLEPLQRLNIGLSYVYEWFQVLKVKQYPVLAAGVAATEQTDRLGGLRLTAIWDNLDNRFDPRNGISTYQEAQWLDPTFGGEHRLLRYEGNVRLLRQTRGRVGFWSSLRGGVIGAWSAGVPRLRTKIFRLGGASSVRGYARDAVSPYTTTDARNGSTIVDDQGQPIAVETGGRWFVNGQAETRVLLTDAIDLALFVDGATITGFDGQRVDAAGTGAGFLYHTPAGPIRLDIGRKLMDLPTDTGGDFRVHFYVLTTF